MPPPVTPLQIFMLLYRHLPRIADTPIALTIGNFDGVHCGHRAMVSRLIAAGRSRGLPTAVMTFEPHPRELLAADTAPVRLSPLRDKIEQLAALGVDRLYVCRFDRAFASQAPDAFVRDMLVRRLGVRWLLVGDDFRFGSQRRGDFGLLSAMAPGCGMEVEAMPSVTVAGVRSSSTAIRAALAEGRIADAHQLLGRAYSVTGRVVGGDRIGRELGYPTANVHIGGRRMPLAGIFVVEVLGLGPAAIQGAASLGTRPTVSASGRCTLEVFLLDFDRDVYGCRARVEFLHKLRDEEKYDTLTALQAQIGYDVAATRDYFRRLRPALPHPA